MDRPPGYELAANPLVSWEIGEPKAAAYDSFRFVDSRRISQESINAATECLTRLWWARWHRDLAVRRVALGKVTINAARAEMGLPPFGWPVINPEPRYTVVSDVTLEGEEAAQALGLDDEWRAILGMPPSAEVAAKLAANLSRPTCPHQPTMEELHAHGGEWTCPECQFTWIYRPLPYQNRLRRSAPPKDPQ